jgi:hypothetical protein
MSAPKTILFSEQYCHFGVKMLEMIVENNKKKRKNKIKYKPTATAKRQK